MRKPVFTEKQIRQILRRYDGRSETITELVKKFRCARHNIRATAFANGYCTGSVAKFGIWAKTEKPIPNISRTYSARN